MMKATLRHCGTGSHSRASARRVRSRTPRLVLRHTRWKLSQKTANATDVNGPIPAWYRPSPQRSAQPKTAETCLGAEAPPTPRPANDGRRLGQHMTHWMNRCAELAQPQSVKFPSKRSHGGAGLKRRQQRGKMHVDGRETHRASTASVDAEQQSGSKMREFDGR